MASLKNKSLQGVLFDWDGTLIDSYSADSSAYLAMFREMGIPWGLKELAQHYSPNWYRVYRAAKLPRARWDDADRAWRAQYAKHSPQLISGARQVLERLGRAHHLGLVTSGDRDRVVRQLREFRLTRMFGARVCSGDTAEKKPHPAPLRLALRQLSLAPAACVYIGDSPEDVEMANRAGVRAIAVLGPFPTEKRLRAARPDFLLASIRELPDALKRLRG
ncbi:MAG TPA: HAD family hydrolase [Verrucomicrobiae bacterium]|jgi:HAD superfamily hydrolase (TIGR01509 family)|nr:HAD family hydrolase [Verrucomicrobiae bacterium]